MPIIKFYVGGEKLKIENSRMGYFQILDSVPRQGEAIAFHTQTLRDENEDIAPTKICTFIVQSVAHIVTGKDTGSMSEHEIRIDLLKSIQPIK